MLRPSEMTYAERRSFTAAVSIIAKDEKTHISITKELVTYPYIGLPRSYEKEKAL